MKRMGSRGERVATRLDVLAPGSRLGRYENLGRLAVGGMAEIYLARTGQRDAQKLVVVKRILPSFADNPEYVSMFVDEARLASALHHPNIVKVYEAEVSEGSYFFAMEYVRGESLQKLLAARRSSGR